MVLQLLRLSLDPLLWISRLWNHCPSSGGGCGLMKDAATRPRTTRRFPHCRPPPPWPSLLLASFPLRSLFPASRRGWTVFLLQTTHPVFQQYHTRASKVLPLGILITAMATLRIYLDPYFPMTRTLRTTATVWETCRFITARMIVAPSTS